MLAEHVCPVCLLRFHLTALALRGLSAAHTHEAHCVFGAFGWQVARHQKTAAVWWAWKRRLHAKKENPQTESGEVKIRGSDLVR